MIDLALSLLIAALNHASEISTLIQNAKAQNRDLTLAEIQAVFDADSLARAKLTIDIATAKAAGK